MDRSARLLALLSLLQRRRHWTGSELADRIGVTTRTVRRDVDRLRALGFMVDAAPGVAGGYQLGTGGAMPPLLVDDDEAIAIAVALSVAAGGGGGDLGDAALAALTKLDRLLPARLRGRVASIRSATIALTPLTDPVDPAVLVVLAQACDANERIAVHYCDREGRESQRRLEPHRLVATGRRWYVLAYDLDRDDWRTLRVDRVTDAHATGHRFAAREVPDPAKVVGEAITTAPYRYQGVIVIDAPVDDLRRRIPPTVGVIRPHERGSELTVGADDLGDIAAHLVGLGVPFEVLAPAELRRHVRALGERLAAAHAREPRPRPVTPRRPAPSSSR